MSNLIISMMKKKILFISMIALAIGSASYAAHNNANDDTDKKDVRIRIAKYKDDKTCAISYTFDDGLTEHYTLVYPYFEKLKFKGTFWINGRNISENEISIQDSTRMTWEQIKEMSDKGHEISNHGWAHRNHQKYSLDVIEEDIYKNDSAIYKHTGIMPRTFCYPNNKRTPDSFALASKNRVGTRTFQHAIGGRSTTESLDNWVADLIQNRKWGVGMTHGLTYKYDAFTDVEIFWDHLDKVKKQEDKIWIGTFAEVAAYNQARQNIKLDITHKRNEIAIIPNLQLDENIFFGMLTMRVDKKGMKKITVKQDNKRLPVQVFQEKAIFDFNPYGGKISIVLK